MRRWPAIALAVLGSVHMIGHFLDVAAIKGLAAATVASPAPKVFSSVQGLETYSTSFVLEWDEAGETKKLELTQDVYQRLEGPYNRRNVYGAVLAFGPVLAKSEAAKPMFESVLRYAACGERPLFAELGIDPSNVGEPVAVRVIPAEGVELPHLPLYLEAPCR